MDPSLPQRKVDIILRRVGDIPSLPAVVNNIIDLMGKPQSSAAEIAKLISYDPGLTSKCLRMVNSSAYGFQRQISSVQHAIMILGFNTVRGIVLSASIFKLFANQRHASIDPSEFWRHSICTAIGSRILASKWKIPYADDAFSAGLLHDIGKMILLHYFTSDYESVLLEAKKHKTIPHGLSFLSIEQSILQTDHTDVGYQLAQRWRLPSTFSETIRFHHHPQEASNAQELVYVIALANAFSHLIQFNFNIFNSQFIPPEVLEYFQFDPEDPKPFENLFIEVCNEADSIEELLQSLSH